MHMSRLRVALLQMASAGTDQKANLSKGEAFCRKAKDKGADLALLPEMWNVGYCLCKPGETAEWERRAVNRDDPYVKHFVELARELEMAIAVTYLERWPGAPRNSVSLIDRTGKMLMTYAKVHTCDFDKEIALTPGDDFYVCDLDTGDREVKIGAMICYDREFPESARILMLKGAEIILTPNACELEVNRLAQFRSRAFENMVGVAMANYAAPNQNGHSIAFHPVAYDRNEVSQEMLLVEAGEDEGVYLAEFDLDEMRAYRASEPWGNAFRKPGHYELLTSTEVREPFVRDSARR